MSDFLLFENFRKSKALLKWSPFNYIHWFLYFLYWKEKIHSFFSKKLYWNQQMIEYNSKKFILFYFIFHFQLFSQLENKNSIQKNGYIECVSEVIWVVLCKSWPVCFSHLLRNSGQPAISRLCKDVRSRILLGSDFKLGQS